MIELKQNHRRSISISLHLLDKQLCQWTEWLQGHVAPGVMYQQQNRLSARHKKELYQHIDELRQLMLRLRDDLQLVSTKPSTAQLIVGQATIVWEMLAELNSRSLQGYGAVPQDLANYLDPIGEKLASQMQEVSIMFSKMTKDD
jgi:hypothetical protein